eukprot:gene39768-48418_t
MIAVVKAIFVSLLLLRRVGPSASQSSADYFIRTYAGYTSSNYNSRGDDGPALAGIIDDVRHVFADTQNNYYVTDSSFIRKVTTSTNIISTYAGGGAQAYFDGILATSTYLNSPWGVAGDTAGNIYFGDRVDCCIRHIATNTKVMSTVVGLCGSCAVDLSASVGASFARLMNPRGIFYYAPDNALYIADTDCHVVKVYSIASSTVSRVMGTGTGTFNLPGGTPSQVALNFPCDVFVDS